MADSSSLFQATKIYGAFERHGVTWIVAASLLSLFAIVFLLLFGKPKNAYPRTHVLAYFLSLLVANAIQASGTAMCLRWVVNGQIDEGTFCQMQGAIKQTGNVATAMWSFMIALHLFNLLFLRLPTTKLGLAATLSFGWAFVATIVILGPAAIQSPDKGFYFGISGSWCWITNGYPKEQTFLEYFFEFLSAGSGFVLYVIILLRVRGNIVFADNRWRLRFVPKGQGWQLALGRDILDTVMLKAAKHMVWYPIVYTIILVPIALSRLIRFAGGSVPDWAPIVADVWFNLTGFINVVIFLATRKFFPEDVATLPEFTTPRKDYSPTFAASGGLSPFPFTVRQTEKHVDTTGPTGPTVSHSRFSVSSAGSVASQTPLREPDKILTRLFTIRRQ